MLSNLRNLKAFTLIELLIVVAIIAILAAIAVPNFMEAQTRAKVSRVKSDLRSLATAQESYMVDYNSYTFKDAGDDETYTEGFRFLTSPVAYISSVPKDPFGYHKYTDGTFRSPMYEMGCGNSHTLQSTRTPDNPRAAGFPADIYIMVSAGPNKRDDTSNDPITGVKLTEGTFPWPHLSGTQTEANAVLALSYDSTNGTKSGGQVYRVGGAKPSGIIFDYLFMGGTR